MKTIYKYKPRYGGLIELPKDAIFLKLALIDDEAYFWFLVNTENSKVERFFNSVGTGWNMQESFLHSETTYLDTVFDNNGSVWHWFELNV